MSLPARTKALLRPREGARPARDEAGCKPQGACHRKARRRPTALPALLTFTNTRIELPCTVADMSGTGARIDVAAETIRQLGDTEHLPDRLVLVLRADRMQVDCEVRWRRPGRIGVRFLGAPRPLAGDRR